MIAEILLLLAGHKSSLFPVDDTLDPAFAPLLHPGEQQCLESLGLIAYRYRRIQDASKRLSRSSSRYVSALCATLQRILKDEYEALVVQTEEQILRRDANLVASGSFVPLSSIRATFMEWDTPFIFMLSLVDELESRESWQPGPLIDMLVLRSHTGVQKVARILARLSTAVQQVWMTQLAAFLLHSSLSSSESLANKDYTLRDGSMPASVSPPSRDSIAYIARAIGTVKDAAWQNQLPRSLASEYMQMLEGVLPEDAHAFDHAIADIRSSVGEWLWLNVLTREDVDAAVEALADYFLLRNGEFGLAFIREIEQLKINRLTARVGPSSMIREQDLQLALLRASLGTSAQHDPSLGNLRCTLPSGPLHPLLPSFTQTGLSRSRASVQSLALEEQATFDDLLLGTPMRMTYAVQWPLDLFLQPADLRAYGALFAYVAALRRTHVRVHACWAALSNAQRARRRWTGLGEGGTAEDARTRHALLRCGWGVVRQMGFFLDALLEYVMVDVVDAEFRRLKARLARPQPAESAASRRASVSSALPPRAEPKPAYLDFTTLRAIHATYLDRLLIGSLLANPTLTALIRPILETCEQLVAQVERWGGDVLPALLFEGSAQDAERDVGSLVRERWGVVSEINQSFQSLSESFYEQLAASTSQQPQPGITDASRSLANATAAFQTTFVLAKGGPHGVERNGDVRRLVERLLLRLDFNGGFTKPVRTPEGEQAGNHELNILQQGGL